ncbi:MFS transporter [Cereibacter sp. SYSU M97828]|nr:MFS transporter [Cereibacter flavus]
MTATPDAFPIHRALPYFAAAIVLALSQGLAQGFVSTNLPQFAGDLGSTTTEASWLMAAYMVPRASLPIMLVKIRTQYGLRRFAEIGVALYVIVAFISVWVEDLRSAIVVQFLSGVASAPLSTLAFLYMIEPLSPQWKMRLGLPMALLFLMNAPSLARVISPALIGDGGLTAVHLTALGMAMCSVALVFLLPLRPVPHQKVIQKLDFVSFALIAFGFGGITIGFLMGPIHWWTDAGWIGLLLAGSVLSLALAVAIELRRETPLVDIRWICSPAILHLAVTLFLFRLVLSEQSTGAPRLFQALGMGPQQLVPLFVVICIACVMGALACTAWMKPQRLPMMHLVALILIAAGALMDAHSSIDTRPEQMIVSQALIGFAGMLFMPPAMVAGLTAALAKGPTYLLSFIIVFLSTQSLGGVVGSGLFTTLVNHRQALHLQILNEQVQPTDPATMAAIAARTAALAPQIGDGAMRRAQAMALIAQDTSNQAYVLAYNDAYFITFLIACAAAAALLLHLLRDWLVARMPGAPTTPAPEAAK